MYASTVAILAAVAVIASAAPAPQQQQLALGADFWSDCTKLLNTSNIAVLPATPLDIGKLTANNGLWYLAAYPKAWMNSAFGTDVGTPTCTNWTITTDAAKNVTTMNLNIPGKVATTVYMVIDISAPSRYQILQSTSGTTVTGISFLQLDDNNAALVGCTTNSAPAPGATTYFWNVLTRNQTGSADPSAMAKITAQAAAVSPTIDVNPANYASHSNEQCAAPSGATQITAMSGLVLAVIALLASHLL